MLYVSIFVELVRARPALAMWIAALAQAFLWTLVPTVFYSGPPGDVPGGRAPYPSTVVMGAVSARAAGVSDVAVCSPPGSDGELDPVVLGACALLLAGILGNLTDRVRLGYVVDFIVLHAGNYHWPTFNVADASITIGAFLLAYDLIFSRRSKTQDVSGTVSHR